MGLLSMRTNRSLTLVSTFGILFLSLGKNYNQDILYKKKICFQLSKKNEKIFSSFINRIISS